MRTRPWTWLLVVPFALAGCAAGPDAVSAGAPTGPVVAPTSATATETTSAPGRAGEMSPTSVVATGAPGAVATSRPTATRSGAVRGAALRTLTPQAVTPPQGVPLPSSAGARSAGVAQTASSAVSGRVGSQAEEREVVRLTNLERAKAGCPALTVDSTLTKVARAHSKDMAVRVYFRHDNPDGLSPFDRMRNAGYRYRTAAENIAAGQPNAETVVRDWMLSPGHRENILDCSLREIGVGLYLSNTNSYTYLWTQDFGTPM